MTNVTSRRFPFWASVSTEVEGSRLLTWSVYKQSANAGHVLHPYPVPTRVSVVPSPPSIAHDRPAASRRSMIVGTHGTGLARYGPNPFWSGMQDGTSVKGPLLLGRHAAYM